MKIVQDLLASINIKHPKFYSVFANTVPVRFQCNICGQSSRTRLKNLKRESTSCGHCGSTVRMRGLVHLLSLHLFGESLSLNNFPIAKQIRGIGLSDWAGYAEPLEKCFDYKNTYYHKEPRLDICNPNLEIYKDLDFVLSSDVFEHVVSPVQLAFDGAYKILKPGGAMIFTVPFNLWEQTTEHFQDLFDFEIKEENGTYYLLNRKKDGQIVRYDNLIFHGGPGQTVEMRVFGLVQILAHLKAAGFSKITVFDRPVMSRGIFWEYPWAVPLVAIK